jgi:hypothetical protein
MTDEKEPKSKRIGVKDGPEAEEQVPAVVKHDEVAKNAAAADDSPANEKSAAAIADPSPISSEQASAIERKVAQAASEVHVAQKKTHDEHIDHVLTRGRPMKPAHSVRVRLAYGDHKVAAEDAPREANVDLKPRRLLAEYDTTAEVLHAAETLRDAGYKSFEAHSPFPIHGMDAAMGLPDSKLGWIVLLCGLTGVSSAWLLMYWTNAVDYPLIIGGKPPGALPSMVPIMFELTVLLSAFGAVFGMFGLNRLPQHHDPLFYSDRFAAFSNDKFFISVEAEDPKFDVEKTRALLEKTKPQAIEVIETIEEVES